MCITHSRLRRRMDEVHHLAARESCNRYQISFAKRRPKMTMITVRRWFCQQISAAVKLKQPPNKPKSQRRL